MLVAQRHLGNQAALRILTRQTAATYHPPIVQREDGETASSSRPRTYQVTFGRTYTLRTFRDAFDLSYDLADRLHQSMDGLDRTTTEYSDARQWLTEISEVQRYLLAHEDETVGEFTFSQIQLWFDEFRRVEQGVRDAQTSRARADLRDAQRRVNAAESALRAQENQLWEAMRAAYMSGDSDKIAEMSSFVGNVLDIGLGLRDLSRQLSEGIAALGGVTLPAASRYVPVLEQANRVLAVVNLTYQLAHMDAPTELGTALNQVSGAVGVFSAGGTLLGLSAHIGLITNLYLVPVVTAITARLNRIVDQHLHELNLVSQAIGWGAEMSSEPGGVSMYQFMTAVMRAQDESEIPWPPPEAVSNYLVRFREEISAGAGSELPTQSSWILWRRLNEERARGWVLDHREQMWHMFYGALQVPRR
jgi:hypothetical protein